MKFLVVLINLVRISLLKKLRFINLKFNKLVLNCVKLLYSLGFISGFTILKNKYLKIYFKYIYKKSVINEIFLISKPSFFIYKKKIKLKNNLNLNYFLICSSSKKKILTDIQMILLNTGGKLLFGIC